MLEGDSVRSVVQLRHSTRIVIDEIAPLVCRTPLPLLASSDVGCRDCEKIASYTTAAANLARFSTMRAQDLSITKTGTRRIIAERGEYRSCRFQFLDLLRR